MKEKGKDVAKRRKEKENKRKMKLLCDNEEVNREKNKRKNEK